MVVQEQLLVLDSDRGLLKLKMYQVNINVDDTITSQTSGTSIVKRLDVATASVDVVLLQIQMVNLLMKMVKFQKTTMRIQDSLYYQDYSYVIKGQSIANCTRRI